MRRLLTLLPVLALGCSSAVEEGTSFDDGRGPTGQGATGLGSLEGAPRLAYPEAPYAVETGGVIENFRFLGWSRPRDAQYDPSRFEVVSFADFYDPSGAKGVRFLVVTVGAVWCSACRTEYADLTPEIIGQYRAQGVEFLGTLFEDNESGPATPEDLTKWATVYDVTFPFVLDPALKLGSLFDRQATPMSMVIDARTMRILSVDTGWASQGEYSLWAYLDQLLGS